MNCSNCHQQLEAEAAFCGNCGQAVPEVNAPDRPAIDVFSPMAVAAESPVATAVVPNYALATPAQHEGETKALLSLVFGIIGVMGAAIIPLLGLISGIAGIVMGSMSRSSNKRGMSTAGLIISGLAILAGLASWAHTLASDPALHHKTVRGSSPSSLAVAAADLSTPCYSVGFVDTLNVNHGSGSCDMSAYSGNTLESSTNAYKVYASQSRIADANTFGEIAKRAIDKDIKNSLPGFSVDTEQAALFAGSPAYLAHVSDKAHGVAVVEAAVFHKTASGNDIFILVHANTGKTANLTILETQWQWK